MTESGSGKPSRRKKASHGTKPRRGNAGANPKRPRGKPKSGTRPPSRPVAQTPISTEERIVLPPIPALPALAAGDSFVVPESVAGHTVLALLRAIRPGESWSKLRDQMHRAFVSLNGVVCVDEARRIAGGDVLVLTDRPRPLPPRPADAQIEYVDAHVVVVQKPSGMMTHRRPEERQWSAERKARQPTLDESLNELLARRAAASGRSGLRSGLVRCVHRLDRDTSGILVFARNEDAEENLIAQFRRHSVHRVYWAIVHGRPQDGTIVSNLVRDRGDGSRVGASVSSRRRATPIARPDRMRPRTCPRWSRSPVRRRATPARSQICSS